MIARYPALYRDAHSEETTEIENNGKTLRMIVRGVEFTGEGFEDFEPSTRHDDSALAPFSLYCGSLCSCMIGCDKPVPVAFGDEVLDGLLHVHLELGDPRPDKRGGIDRIDLLLTLTVADKVFHSCGQHGWFDNELLEIEATLPEGMYLRCCHYCACANYGPLGSPLFGGLYCFKDSSLRHSFRSKGDLFRLIYTEKAPEVQETYLCPEFTRRKPGIAHRP